MDYEKIWNKILGDNEKIEYQFSIGNRYANFGLIIWAIIALIFILLGARPFGIFIFIITLFYYAFYLKVANAYALTNKRVLFHKGWLSTHTVSVDYSKITDVHVIEPFLERIITRTGHIGIITAGTTRDQIVLYHIENPYEVKRRLDSLKDNA